MNKVMSSNLLRNPETCLEDAELILKSLQILKELYTLYYDHIVGNNPEQPLMIDRVRTVYKPIIALHEWLKTSKEIKSIQGLLEEMKKLEEHPDLIDVKTYFDHYWGVKKDDSSRVLHSLMETASIKRDALEHYKILGKTLIIAERELENYSHGQLERAKLFWDKIIKRIERVKNEIDTYNSSDEELKKYLKLLLKAYGEVGRGEEYFRGIYNNLAIPAGKQIDLINLSLSNIFDLLKQVSQVEINFITENIHSSRNRIAVILRNMQSAFARDVEKQFSGIDKRIREDYDEFMRQIKFWFRGRTVMIRATRELRGEQNVTGFMHISLRKGRSRVIQRILSGDNTDEYVREFLNAATKNTHEIFRMERETGKKWYGRSLRNLENYLYRDTKSNKNVDYKRKIHENATALDLVYEAIRAMVMQTQQLEAMESLIILSSIFFKKEEKDLIEKFNNIKEIRKQLTNNKVIKNDLTEIESGEIRNFVDNYEKLKQKIQSREIDSSTELSESVKADLDGLISSILKIELELDKLESSFRVIIKVIRRLGRIRQRKIRKTLKEQEEAVSTIKNRIENIQTTIN